MDVSIRSAKNNQFKQRVNVIPVVKAISTLCPVDDLRLYIKLSGRQSEEVLFPLSYSVYVSKLKDCIKRIGLVGYYSSHSVRRGAANFLSTFLPLHQVKQYGDWKSWAVLLYLADNYRGRKVKDLVVARQLESYV